MKYRINLYPEDLRPKVELFTVTFVAIVWVVSGSILFGLGQSYQSDYHLLQDQTRDTQNLYSQKTGQLSALTQARDTRKQDDALLAQVEKLQSEVRAKQLLLQELKGREQLKNHGFSSLMQDLADHHQPGLWLTRINIHEQNVRMEGMTNSSEAVPGWIRQLRGADYFHGQNFAAARMYRNDEGSLNFIISSDLVELVLEDEAGEAQ